MMKSWLKGGLIGLLISLIIMVLIVASNVDIYYNRQQFYYERFKLCEPCGMPRNLDCVIEKCVSEETKIFYRDNFQNELSLEDYLKIQCSKEQIEEQSKMDLRYGLQAHIDAFINGFCGYELWDGFGYGTKPSKIKTFFTPHVIAESLGFTLFVIPPLFYLVVLAPFAGALIGFLIRKRK